MYFLFLHFFYGVDLVQLRVVLGRAVRSLIVGPVNSATKGCGQLTLSLHTRFGECLVLIV